MAVWILDASHGGNDPGIIGSSLGKRESDIVLEAVLIAKKHLERNGENVILTRHSDVDITLEQRLSLGKEIHKAYYITFNMNSNIDKNTKGVQAYYLSDDEDDERLARLIRDEIFSGLRTEDRGVFKDSTDKYSGTGIKGVIVYGDYLSNDMVEKEFDPKKYGEAVAKACLALVDKVLLKIPVREPKKMQKRAYRVCIGYYKDFDEALIAAKELKVKGFKKVYITPYDGK